MADPNLKTDLMDWNNCAWVESVPERMHGTPVLLRSRMPADGVLENFDEGMTVDELVEDYGLEKDAVVGVLQFAGRLKQATAA
jgi:uncharacterized protein (DUF433 family)